MGNIFEVFPDIEEVLRALVLQDFPDDFGEENIGTEFPEDLAGRLDYLRIDRLGGQRSRLNDYPTVDLEVFSATNAGARLLLERLDAYILGYPRSVAIGERMVTVDNAQVSVSPHRLPWEDSNIRRYASTYQLSVRR